MVVSHPHYPNFSDWYPQEDQFGRKRALQFLDGLDALLLFENGFYWDVVSLARARKIPIILVPNYEYTPYPPPTMPDLWLCGSLLDVAFYKDHPHVFLEIPVETDRIRWKLRNRAEVFVHNAGHGQRGFAKGTPQIVEAMKYVQSPLRLIVRGQTGERRIAQLFREQGENSRVEFVYGDLPDEMLFDEGDVFINAEQFNGLSLMLQEAYTSGMLVMTSDRYPMNTWLPTEPLITVDHYERDRIMVDFDRAVIDPREIARKMDEWYLRDITQYSLLGKQWAEAHSWEAMRSKYLDLLGSVQCAL
jgi:hypothetical protein